MSHVFFFSYASENRDNKLEGFFEDLCEEVAPYTKLAKDDPGVSFRDGKNIPLMEGWRPTLLQALQTSAVLVCVTSPAYFSKTFCGQEYYIFDQRRRQNIAPGGNLPRVVLPVIWAPVDGKLPFSDEIQMKTANMSEAYFENGLRYLKKLDSNEYEKCVAAFAKAIRLAWKEHESIPPLANVQPFDQIPNAFAGGAWEEAAGPGGWLPGPGVANFVFAAARGKELADPPGRYGARAADWRPYLPPDPRTIEDISKEAAKKHSLRYREIPVDPQLSVELKGALDRKNLTLMLVDPKTLPIEQYQKSVSTFDKPANGNALLMLWDGAAGPWEDDKLQKAVSATFPVTAQLNPPSYLAPVPNVVDLVKKLDTTLADLCGGLTKAEAEKKPKTDEAPAQVSGPTGADT